MAKKLAKRTKKKRKQQTAVDDPSRPGPKTKYPGKLRDKPITFTAPQVLHDVLEDGCARNGGITKSEFLCALLADHGPEKCV